jgi:hypothetical protein
MKKLNFLLLMALIIGVLACRKNRDEPEPDNNVDLGAKTELISKTWAVTAVQINEEEQDAQNYDHYRFTFEQDGTYHFVKNESSTGTWEFNSNASAMLLDGGTERARSVDVLELTENALQLRFTEGGTSKTGGVATHYHLVPAND